MAPQTKFSTPKRPKTTKKVKKQKTFANLVKHWNKKLAESGFKDIEYPSTDKAAAHLLKCASLHEIARSYKPDRLEYYRRLLNFCTHNPAHYKFDWQNAMALAYANGVTLREIVLLLKRRGKSLSIWSVHKFCHAFAKLAIAWNFKHFNGIDFVADIGRL